MGGSPWPARVVMAGGQGTRLRPLTVTIPKPMLPVGRRAIIEIILRQIRNVGIERIFVSVGYRGYLVRSYLRELDLPGVSIEIVEEQEPLGTAGPLALLPPGYDDVFLMNGDVLTRAPIDEAVEAHRTNADDLTMLVHRHPVALPYGLLEIEGGGWSASARSRRSSSRWPPACTWSVGTSSSSTSSRGERCDMPDLIGALIGGAGSVGAFEFDQMWTDVADLADFEKINLTSDEWEDL